MPDLRPALAARGKLRTCWFTAETVPTRSQKRQPMDLLVGGGGIVFVNGSSEEEEKVLTGGSKSMEGHNPCGLVMWGGGGGGVVGCGGWRWYCSSCSGVEKKNTQSNPMHPYPQRM